MRHVQRSPTDDNLVNRHNSHSLSTSSWTIFVSVLYSLLDEMNYDYEPCIFDDRYLEHELDSFGLTKKER